MIRRTLACALRAADLCVRQRPCPSPSAATMAPATMAAATMEATAAEAAAVHGWERRRANGATMEAAIVEAVVEGVIMEVAIVKSVIEIVEGMIVKSVIEVVEGVIVKSAMEVVIVEVVIVKSAIEISANKAAEADATVIRPTIIPVRIVPGGIVVDRFRYGRDTAWRGRRGSTGSVRSDRGVQSARRRRGWRRGRVRGTFSGRGGARRRRGADSGGRWARHKIVAVCLDRLIRATGKLCRSNHRNDRGQSMTATHGHLLYHAPTLALQFTSRAAVDVQITPALQKNRTDPPSSSSLTRRDRRAWLISEGFPYSSKRVGSC